MTLFSVELLSGFIQLLLLLVEIVLKIVKIFTDARNGTVFDITYDTGPCHLEGMFNVLAQDIELVEVASLNRVRDIVVALLIPLRVLQCGTPVPSGHRPSHFGLVFLDECACTHPFIVINLHWLLIMSNRFAFALCGHLTRLTSEGSFLWW